MLKIKLEILERAFQINHDNLLRRWPRFAELFDWYQQASDDSQPVETFSLRDWRDLQLSLSLPGWTNSGWLTTLSYSAWRARARISREEDKQELREKQLQLLHDVLPEYRRALDSGQIEISTTPYYHPILPLICDTDSGRISNPSGPPLQPPFQHPEDAREQLRRARSYHERTFGQPPVGLMAFRGFGLGSERSNSPPNSDSAGSARTKVCSAVRLALALDAMRPASRRMPSASIRRCACAVAKRKLRAFFATTIFPTLSASFTAG